MEARKRLARLVGTTPSDIFWVQGWTTLRSAPEDNIQLQAQSVKIGSFANVHADHPALVEMLEDLAEARLGTITDDTLFWAEYRFVEM